MHKHNIFCLLKVMWSKQRLLCVDTGFSVSACLTWVLFQMRKLLFGQDFVIYILYYES